MKKVLVIIGVLAFWIALCIGGTAFFAADATVNIRTAAPIWRSVELWYVGETPNTASRWYYKVKLPFIDESGDTSHTVLECEITKIEYNELLGSPRMPGFEAPIVQLYVYRGQFTDTLYCHTETSLWNVDERHYPLITQRLQDSYVVQTLRIRGIADLLE